MAELLKGVLTSNGLSLVARAQAGAATITFTRFEIGNGDWGADPSVTTLQAATALKSEKASFDISKCEYVNPATSLLTLIASNKNNKDGGYYVTEVGVYASDGSKEILYAIYVMAQGKGDWFPAYNSLIPSSLVYNCNITVANAESVTIKADAAGLALQVDLEAAEARITALEQGAAGCVGIRKKCTADGIPQSGTEWERFGRLAGMTAVYARDNNEIDDPIMGIWPYNRLRPCDLNLDGTVAAYKGDPDFTWEPESGCVMLEVPNEMYFSRWYETDADGQNWEYRVFSDTGRYPNAVYIKDLMKRSDGSTADYFYFPIFLGYLNSAGNYVSKANVIPTYNRSCTSFRTDVKKNGDNWQLIDKWAWDIITNLIIIYAANDNVRTTFGRGHADWYCTYTSLLAESNVNTITISNSAKSNLFVGNTVCIGASGGWNASVTQDRTITAIETSSKADNAIDVTLSGNAFTTTTTSTLWRSAPRTGETVNMANANGTAGANDGKHAVRTLWIEDFYATMHTGIDGMNLKLNESDMCLDVYVCDDPSKYADSYTDYTKVDTMKIALNGSAENYDYSGWIKQEGFDKDYPTLETPIMVDAGSESYLAAYRWANRNGARPFAGGSFADGSRASVRSLGCHSGFGLSSWHFGSRPLKR